MTLDVPPGRTSRCHDPAERLMASNPDEPKPPEGGAAPPPAPAEEAPRAKHTIGALLRETRENYGGDLERIAAALRIKPAYLTALEEGRYDRLPAPVYALGFMRAYAIHMGLDGEEAVRRFKQEANGLEISRDLVFPIPLADHSIPRKPILIAGLLLLIAAYAVWYYFSSGDSRRPERVSEVPAELMANQPGAGGLAPAPAISPPEASAAMTQPTKPLLQAPPPPVAVAPPALSPPPQQALAPPPSPPPANAASTASDDANHVFGLAGLPVRIVIRAKGESWLEVRDRDQNLLFQRLMKRDDVYRVPDRPGLSFMTGNAAALDVTVDGNPAPPLSGTVKHDILLDPARLLAGTAVVN